MPRFDVFQKGWVDGKPFGESKVRVSGDDPVDAAINWVKMHGYPRSASKDAKPLGGITYEINVSYKVGEIYCDLRLVPVFKKSRQCSKCGYPDTEPDQYCDGDCAEWRKGPDIDMDMDIDI